MAPLALVLKELLVAPSVVWRGWRVLPIPRWGTTVTAAARPFVGSPGSASLVGEFRNVPSAYPLFFVGGISLLRRGPTPPVSFVFGVTLNLHHLLLPAAVTSVLWLLGRGR